MPSFLSPHESGGAEPIKNCRPPTNVSELRAVLGLFNVGRTRVPHFATIAKPLSDLLKKGASFDFGEKAIYYADAESHDFHAARG